MKAFRQSEPFGGKKVRCTKVIEGVHPGFFGFVLGFGSDDENIILIKDDGIGEQGDELLLGFVGAEPTFDGMQIGDGVIENIHILDARAVVGGLCGKMNEAIFDVGIDQSRVWTSSWSIGECGQRMNGIFEFVEERRNAHGFEQAACGEKRVALGSSKADFAGTFDGLHTPMA